MGTVLVDNSSLPAPFFRIGNKRVSVIFDVSVGIIAARQIIRG